MIQFACPKCAKEFRVADSAVGQHGWCKGCGAIIRVPASSGASESDILDIQLDPQVQALLRHMATQLKEQRVRVREMQDELRVLRNTTEILQAHERIIANAEAFSRNLQRSGNRIEEEHRAMHEQSRQLFQALHEVLDTAWERAAAAGAAHTREHDAGMQEELEAERTRHAEANARLRELELHMAAMEQERGSREAELARLHVQIERAGERTAELASRCGKLEEQTAVLRRERDEARRLLEDRSAAADETHVVAVRLQEKESLIQRLSEELRAALETKGELDLENRRHLDDIDHLCAEISGITQSADAEIAEMREELNTERDSRALAQQILAEAQDELRELRRAADAAHDLRTKNAELERELAKAREATESAEAALDERQERLEEVLAQLHRAEGRLEALDMERPPAQPTQDGAVPGVQAPGLASSADTMPVMPPSPFSGPFSSPPAHGSGDQGIALIPEVLDDDYDDREMLDTLMRFLGPGDMEE